MACQRSKDCQYSPLRPFRYFRKQNALQRILKTAGRTERNGTMYRRKKERWSILKIHNRILSDSLGMNTSTMMVNSQAMEHARKEAVRV